MNRIVIPEWVWSYLNSSIHPKYLYQSTVRGLTHYLNTDYFSLISNDQYVGGSDIVCIETKDHLATAIDLFGGDCQFIRLSLRDKYNSLDSSLVIEAKSFCLRPRYPTREIPLPLIPDSNNFQASSVKEFLPYDKREFFATFKGRVYQQGKQGDCRLDLLSLKQENGIVIAPIRHRYDNYPDNMSAIFDSAERFDYGRLMNSSFAIVPRGRQPATYRLIECLRIGVVPIIYDSLDRLVMPFQDLIDWNQCAIFADTGKGVMGLEECIESTRLISTSKWNDMILAGCKFYENFFSSHSNAAINIIGLYRQRSLMNLD